MDTSLVHITERETLDWGIVTLKERKAFSTTEE